MTKILTAIGVFAVAGVLSAAPAEQTWTGAVISDSHCGAIHKTDLRAFIQAFEALVARRLERTKPVAASTQRQN